MRGSKSLRVWTVAAVIVMIIGLGSASRATAGPTFEEAVRFLQQATFGPTP